LENSLAYWLEWTAHTLWKILLTSVGKLHHYKQWNAKPNYGVISLIEQEIFNAFYGKDIKLDQWCLSMTCG
jgi:hypothetical protein